MNNFKITDTNMSCWVIGAFNRCLQESDFDSENTVRVETVVRTFRFDYQMLEEKRELVKALLEELPEKFKAKEGDSILNLCRTKNGTFWTDHLVIANKLLALAIGLDLVAYTTPEEMWAIQPGGFPLITIK